MQFSLQIIDFMFFVNGRTKEGCCRKRILPILEPEIKQGLDMSPFWMCFGGGAALGCGRNLPQGGMNESHAAGCGMRAAAMDRKKNKNTFVLASL